MKAKKEMPKEKMPMKKMPKPKKGGAKKMDNLEDVTAYRKKKYGI